MPLSLSNAAQFCNTEEFLFWNPATDTFSAGVPGRMKRADPFVSLWNKASRRANVFFTPGTVTTSVVVIQHNLTGAIFLLSPTGELDAWQGGSAYQEMRRAHKVMPPSGGKGIHRSVTVSGTGDNLGLVTIGPETVAYMDVERSGSSEPLETVATVEQEVYLFCSANVTYAPGDFLQLNGTYYRVDEWFHDTGFLSAKAVKAAPAYTSVTFLIPSATSPVFSPSTGGLTTADYTERAVSVQVDASEAVGRPTDRDFAEKFTLFIYSNHIGFTPFPGQQVVLDGVTYRVVRVDHNLSRLQWKVEIKP